jgi:hypothetical protein
VTPETTQAVFDVARLIAAGIVGGLVATYAGHLLTVNREQHRERRYRKREFRSFIVRLTGFSSNDVHAGAAITLQSFGEP